MKLVKAWIRFCGEGTIHIFDRHRISDTVDHGAGDYSIFFCSEVSK
jgi:hypothetical protein